jgi:8-oxo-dGTP pyrophosphatase MutT (NUDIX family)
MESSIINAVGVWFYSVNTQRYLYLLRNDPKYPGSWGLPGGKSESGETLMDSIIRECKEELGSMPDYLRMVPLEKFTTSDRGFAYHTFFCSVANEFHPVLNDEHIGWAWIASGHWPRPMHPGLWSTVNLDSVRDKISTIEQQIQISQ